MSFRSYDLLKLVERFGETLTLRKLTTEGSYNPATGSVSGSGTTDYSFTGYIYNYEALTADQVQRGTLRCVIPASEVPSEPDDQDQIIRGSQVNIVKSVVTIYSNGTAVCYLCHLEK